MDYDWASSSQEPKRRAHTHKVTGTPHERTEDPIGQRRELRLPGERMGRLHRSQRRGWGNLSAQRQFVRLLPVAVLLCILGTAAAALLGARASALSAAQAAVSHHLLAARQTVSTYGQTLALRDGQLYTDTGYRFNGDTALVDQVTAITGDGVVIYQAENHHLISVASDLPLARDGAVAAPGPGALGDSLSGSAYLAMLAGCLTSRPSPPVHRQDYHGAVTFHGAGYLAAIAPLADDQGTCVGALMVATPIERIDVPLRALAGVLLLVGLGLTGLFGLVGYRLSGPDSRRAYAALNAGLGDVSCTAARMESLADTQTARADRQMTSARQLLDQLRALSEVATAIEHGVAMLRDSTGAIWAELSYPGAVPDAQAGFRAARQTAVVASQIGAAAQQAGALCQHLRARMNQVIAEAGVLGEHGHEVAAQARLLAEAVERVEGALGNRVRPHAAAPAAAVWGIVMHLQATIRAALPEAWLEALGIARETDGPAGADSDPRRNDRRAALGDVASWSAGPGGHPRTTGQRPAIGRISHAPRAGRSGRPSAPNLRPTGFHTSPHRTPINSGGPQPGGSHLGPRGYQRMPWFSGGEDLTKRFPREAAGQTPEEGGAPGSGGPGTGGAGPDTGPRHPRLTPRPDNGQWMNDQP